MGNNLKNVPRDFGPAEFRGIAVGAFSASAIGTTLLNVFTQGVWDKGFVLAGAFLILVSVMNNSKVIEAKRRGDKLLALDYSQANKTVRMFGGGLALGGAAALGLDYLMQ